MYTLWWMSRIFERVRNEHRKCSFWIVCMMHVEVCPLNNTYLRSAWILHMRYAPCMCDIYHDAMLVISLYRRVFDFTVSNVSSVSNLYFSGAERRHVCRHVNVSGVRNRCMYTLWWMMCEIGIWVKWTWDMFVSVTCLTTCGFASWFDLVGDMHRGLRSISSCVLKDVIDIHLGSICECVSYMCALNRESCIRHLDECRQCFRSMIAFWIVACSIISWCRKTHTFQVRDIRHIIQFFHQWICFVTGSMIL